MTRRLVLQVTGICKPHVCVCVCVCILQRKFYVCDIEPANHAELKKASWIFGIAGGAATQCCKELKI